MFGFYVKDGQAIAAGQKRAVLTPTLRDDLSGPRVLVIRNGDVTQAVAVVVFSPPEPLDAAGVKAVESEHCVSSEDRLRWWPGKDTLYLHRVKSIYTLAAPQAIDFEPGSNMNVAAPLQVCIMGKHNDGAHYTYVLGVEIR
jgi:hypothetical protein